MQFHAEMIPVTTREVVVQQRHHRRSMIVEAEESPAAFDDREQSSRGRQSMTLPRSLHQHPQQQYRPPQPPQESVHQSRLSSQIAFQFCNLPQLRKMNPFISISISIFNSEMFKRGFNFQMANDSANI